MNISQNNYIRYIISVLSGTEPLKWKLKILQYSETRSSPYTCISCTGLIKLAVISSSKQLLFTFWYKEMLHSGRPLPCCVNIVLMLPVPHCVLFKQEEIYGSYFISSQASTQAQVYCRQARGTRQVSVQTVTWCVIQLAKFKVTRSHIAILQLASYRALNES